MQAPENKHKNLKTNTLKSEVKRVPRTEILYGTLQMHTSLKQRYHNITSPNTTRPAAKVLIHLASAAKFSNSLQMQTCQMTKLLRKTLSSKDLVKN